MSRPDCSESHALFKWTRIEPTCLFPGGREMQLIKCPHYVVMGQNKTTSNQTAAFPFARVPSILGLPYFLTQLCVVPPGGDQGCFTKRASERQENPMFRMLHARQKQLDGVAAREELRFCILHRVNSECKEQNTHAIN